LCHFLQSPSIGGFHLPWNLQETGGSEGAGSAGQQSSQQPAPQPNPLASLANNWLQADAAPSPNLVRTEGPPPLCIACLLWSLL
jgi:hypothetical protein